MGNGNSYVMIPGEDTKYSYDQKKGNTASAKTSPKKADKSCARLILVLLALAGLAALGVGLWNALKPVGLDEDPLVVVDPPPPSAKRGDPLISSNRKRTVFAYATKKMGVRPRSTVIAATSTIFTLQYPEDLSDFVGQRYIVYSNTTLPHAVEFTPLVNRYAFTHCPRAPGGHPTWDEPLPVVGGKYTIARFIDGQPGAAIHWHVLECGRIVVIAQRHVEYCTSDLTECVIPAVTSTNITELFASTILTDEVTAAQGTIGNLTVYDLSALRAVLVNLTASSVNATELHSVLAHITTLVSQSITSTTAVITNLFATTGQITQLTSTVFTALNGTVTHLESVTAYIQNLFATNANVTNLVGETATITNITTQLLMADQVMNSVLAHTASGVIPPTHARQTLRTVALPPPGVNQTAGLPLGPIAIGSTVSQANASLGFLVNSGCWSVRDLVTSDPYTSISDTGGIRVIQGGEPNTYGITNVATDTACPGNNAGIKMSIFSLAPGLGTIVLHFRYSSETGYDFFTINKGATTLFRDADFGPSPFDAFKEVTLTIPVTSLDTVTIEYLKDPGAWSGYDILYFYASYAPSTALSMTLPTNLTDYVGKDITVCSLDASGHTVESTGAYKLTSDSQWSLLRFEGNGVDACCATFSVTSADQVSVVSRDACSVFCSDSTQIYCVDPLRPAETNALHGNWKNAIKRSGESYVVIDASRNPISVRFHGGTVLTPAEASNTLSFYPIALSVFSTDASTNVANNLFGPLVIRVQPGSRQFVTHFGNEIFTEPQSLFEKIDEIPPFLPTGSGSLKPELPPDHPEAVFMNLVEKFIYNSHSSLSTDKQDEKWVGFYPAIALAKKIIEQGTGPLVAPIIETRTTQLGNPEGITEFRFANYHHISPVSRVVISGFDPLGSCSSLNGEHVVNVATTNNMPLLDPLFEDYGPNPSARTVHHKVGIWFDSSAIPNFPGTNIANCTGTNTPIATASYGPLTGDSDYLQLMGSCFHWFYESMKIGQHFGLLMFFDFGSSTPRSNMALPLEDWASVTAEVALGVVSLTYKSIRSRHYHSASAFYPNGAANIFYSRYLDFDFSAGSTADGRIWNGISDFTGRYGIRPDRESSIAMFQTDNSARSTHYISVPRHNYLQEVAYPAWKMVGTTRTGELHITAQAIYPGGEGDVFDTIMVPFGTLPPTDYSYLSQEALLNGGATSYPYDFEFNIVNEMNQEDIFAGLINPAYTSGLRIGYIRIESEDNLDPLQFSTDKEFCPYAHCQNNYDALTTMYGVMMKYLLVTHSCDHVIIDMRSNGGGLSSQNHAFRNLFGGEKQQPLRSVYGEHAGNGFGPSIDMSTFVYANNILQQGIDDTTADPSATEANEPGSVLTNGQVVVLIDTGSSSAGDEMPNLYLGSAFDGELGNSTHASIVGSIDGRLVSCAVSHNMPLSTEAPRLRGNDGSPFSALRVRIDSECLNAKREDGSWLNNRVPALQPVNTGASGAAGGNALWADWEQLVYPDLGYEPNGRPVLPGWPHPQTPFNVEVTNAISTTIGSNVVTVTMPGPHGFNTGDDVALGSTALPVATTGGIDTRVLTGAHNITVTSPTEFTFVTADFATYPGFDSPVATSTVAAGGGTFRVMNRNHWRDAWLEQSISHIVAIAKKRGHVSKSPEEKSALKERIRQHEARRLKEHQERRFNLYDANKRFRRNVGCPSGAVNLTHIQEARATVNITMPFFTEEVDDVERAREIGRVRSALTSKLMESIHAGGLCFSEDGHLMVVPGGQVPRLVRERKRASSRVAVHESKRNGKVNTATAKTAAAAATTTKTVVVKKTVKTNSSDCIAACGAQTSPAYRKCAMACRVGA